MADEVMIDGRPGYVKTKVPEGKPRWMQRGVLGAVCALVIGVYTYAAHSGLLELLSPNVADTYYNALVQGFRDGQLSLKKEVPAGFALLADPYDPTANTLYRSPPYGLHDLSYYKGRFYLYFGVTPALVLFWPFTALTGEYLFHRQAAAIFCVVGFVASVGLLCAVWRRHFADVSLVVVAACVLGLGLATGVPVLLSRSEVYEVATSCGYMLTMLALLAIWRAVHDTDRRPQWLAAASLMYGLAVGARPSLLFGGIIVLVPVVQAWRERRQIWTLLIAAVGPMSLIGLGLMLYNYLRFDDALEFGQRYQLAGDTRQAMVQHFSLGHLWFNFRIYFLESVGWSRHFPFVQNMVVPTLPPDHGAVEKPFGILTNIPLVWLALAVPLACRGRSAESRSMLCRSLTALAVLFGICTLTMCLYYSACARYEVEFLPTLALLAVIGMLSLERALACRLAWRCVARWGWGLLLGFSVAFNLFEVVENHAEAHYNLGLALWQSGKPEEAIAHYKHALRMKPDYAEAHNNLGSALQQAGQIKPAIAHYEQALRIKPDYPEAHNNLGVALVQVGRLSEAAGHYEQALRLSPDFPEAHCNLALAMEQTGRIEDAVAHFRRALQIRPDFTEARNGLARLHAIQ